MLKNNLIIFLKYPEPGQVKTRLGKVIRYIRMVKDKKY